MSDEIQVTVLRYPDRKNLVLAYVDPVSGKRKTKSAGTGNEQAAWKAAAKWEAELANGAGVAPSKLTWADFRRIVREEKLSEHPPATVASYESSLNRLERVLNPDKLAGVTTAAINRYVTHSRENGMKATNLASVLRSVGACFRWAERRGYMRKAPKIDLPRLPKGFKGKHRPPVAEEYERMLAAVPKVRPDDATAWERLLTGLWLSGLRRGEILALSWEREAPFAVDLRGKRPVFRIAAEAQKSRRAEVCPMAPDFAQWLLATFPEGERRGRVFRLPAAQTGRQISEGLVGKIVGEIARKAGVLVDEVEKTAKINGQLVTRKIPAYASAHDFRRAFCTRWAKRVTPAVLAKLARHASVAVTMQYYVGLDAQDVADDLWERFGGESNIPVTPAAPTEEIPGEIDVFAPSV
jgi:integrase